MPSNYVMHRSYFTHAVMLCPADVMPSRCSSLGEPCPCKDALSSQQGFHRCTCKLTSSFHLLAPCTACEARATEIQACTHQSRQGTHSFTGLCWHLEGKPSE